MRYGEEAFAEPSGRAIVIQPREAFERNARVPKPW